MGCATRTFSEDHAAFDLARLLDLASVLGGKALAFLGCAADEVGFVRTEANEVSGEAAVVVVNSDHVAPLS